MLPAAQQPAAATHNPSATSGTAPPRPRATMPRPANPSATPTSWARRHEPPQPGGEGGQAHLGLHRAVDGRGESGGHRLDLPEHGGALVGQPTPGLGERHPTPDPFQQRLPGLSFQPFDLLGDRRRGVAEGPGCPDHRAVIADRDESGHRSEIDHETTLRDQVKEYVLVLHDRLAQSDPRDDS